jgi:hypothetical protein
MNHSLITADRGTHIRMLMASAACVTVFIAVLVGFQVARDTGQVARFDGATVIKAGQPTAMTNRDTSRMVR